MNLIVIMSDKKAVGEETISRIASLNQLLESPYEEEELGITGGVYLRPPGEDNVFLHLFLLGQELNNVNEEVLVLQEADLPNVEETLELTTDFLIQLYLDIVGEGALTDDPEEPVVEIYDANYKKPDEVRILTFKDKIKIRDICNFLLTDAGKLNIIH